MKAPIPGLEFWPRTRFGGRSAGVYALDVNGRPVAGVAHVLDDASVVCDCCNADLAADPVPVIFGYAHCAACFKKAGGAR